MSRIKTANSLAYGLLQYNITKVRRPTFLCLFITNRCNLRCKYCFVVDDSIPKDILAAEYSYQELVEIIDEFYAMGTRMIFMLGGEPLVHPDIGKIVDYIIDKGIYLHLITNGVLLPKKVDEIKRVDAVCVSLDGIGAINDAMRGDGTFNRAVKGIKASVAKGVSTRIHAVLTRHNLHSVRELAELAKELKVVLTISPPNYLGTTDDPNLRITNEEYKVFWQDYLDLQKQGMPIANNRAAITKCRDWPIDYHQYIRKGQKFSNYTPTFCRNGYDYLALGAEGTMYNCINLGCQNGPNIHEHGIKKAWEMLLDYRPDCVSCASINCIETAMMMNLNPMSIIEAFRFHSTTWFKS